MIASPEVRQHADRQRRREVTRKVRGWVAALIIAIRVIGQ